MKNYKKSDYAANKYAGGIVYQFDGQTIEITLEDYLAENPRKTVQDFEMLKAWSDADYFAQDRQDNRQCKRNMSISDIDNPISDMSLSPEAILFDEADATERQVKRALLSEAALAKLTAVQRRRYLLYTVNGLTTRQIASAESANQKSVYESLQAAEKKINKFLKNT